MTDPGSSAGIGQEALDAYISAFLDDDPSALYERAPCGYLSTLPDGTVIRVNQTFLTLSGYERADLVGRRTFAELLTPGGRIYHETHYAPMLQMQGSAREIALEIVCKDGHRLPVLVNAVLERDESDRPRVVRTAVFDATERRQYEQELVRAKQRAEASEERATLLARTLQQTLIPPTPPDIPGLDVAAAYRPAGTGDEVGGDFYDIFELGPNDWVVAIGDVCGKGVEAAVVTALARHTIRAAAVSEHRPSAILATLNHVLLHHESDRFCTIAVLRLRRRHDAWTATVTCAGHPAPLLRRPGQATLSIGDPGSLLGVLPTPTLFDRETVLEPGDALLLYTDGVTEARAGPTYFGEDRLLVALAGAGGPAGAMVERVLDRVLRFQGDHPRDDIALVAIVVPMPA